jgi:acyl carrier protein
MNNNIYSQVIEIMASTFRVDVTKIPENADPSSLSEWDSIKHLSLIIALEEHFQIRFTDDDTVELISLPLIVLVIESKYA